MSAKNFQDVFNEIKSSVTVSKKGKKVKIFSRSDFDKLAKAFVNDVDYTTTVVSTKAGEVVRNEIKPVQAFRGMVKAILQDFGVDKQEAARILEGSKEIKNVDGLYEFCSELIYNYMKADKKFNFLPKEDFLGSIVLSDVAEGIGDYRDIKSNDKNKKIKIKKKKHSVLEKRSSCPKWLKERI